jgi:hypothetical protein
LSEEEVQRQYLYSWKVAQVIKLLDMYLDDQSIEHLTSAEYELKNLLDGMINQKDPNDPPF